LNGSALIFINILGEERGKQKVRSSPDKSGPAAQCSLFERVICLYV